jgi:DNA phosphorothioation-dependent restriction protein DptH
MSREFYNYLANRTIDFFNATDIKFGDKFILKLDSEEEVENYYSSIEKRLEYLGVKETFKRIADDELFETASFITSSNVKLVIIPELNITNAYLTTLRNTVSVGHAIFIVCHNPIDSIAGGTESLQKKECLSIRIDLFLILKNQ